MLKNEVFVKKSFKNFDFILLLNIYRELNNLLINYINYFWIK